MTASTGVPYHFLAPYYEQLSETRDWDAWLAYIQAILQEASNGASLRILDAACGTGRIAAGLLSLGHSVVGVDASEAMLAQAREKARQFGFTAEFVQQDLRRLQLGQRFDCAVSLCDSLNYLTEPNEFSQGIRNIAHHLEPGGFFLFDVNTQWKLENVYGDYTYAEHRDGFSYIWENEYEPLLRIVRMQLAFFVEGKQGLYQRFDEVHVQRAYTHSEVVQALTDAGLELLSYGELFGWRPPESQQERVFYLARKAASK